MLILTRNLHETIMIGDDIIIHYLAIRGKQIRLGFDVPRHIPVHRKELYDIIGANRLGEYTNEH